MAYDQGLADDVRARLSGYDGITEREMFGGIAFMVNGNMAVGVIGDKLMVRVGKDSHDQVVTLSGARTFDMAGRPMRGWVSVSPEGFESDATLDEWVRRGAAYAESLPRK